MKSIAKVGLVAVVAFVGFAFILLLAGIFFFSRAGKSPARASIHVGKTETRSSLSSSSSSSSSDQATFSSRRVLLVPESSHPLCQRIAALLVDRLNESPQIDKIENANSLASPTVDGTRAPDLFLRLDLADLKESGLGTRSTKARVTAFLGSAPWQSRHFVQDATTPPLVQFAWKGTLDADSTFTGIRSDRYADAANSIANTLAKAIIKEIEKLSAKYPPLPELPPDFYGPYQPVADFDWLRELNARRAGSYHGLLNHNETFWTFESAADPAPALQRVIRQLEANGWRVEDTDLTNSLKYYLRFHLDEAVLEIFDLRPDRLHASSTEEGEAPREFIVHYRKPFSSSEREAAVETLFKEKSSLEKLFPFLNAFSAEQRERFYALIQETPGASPLVRLQLAQNYLNRKQTNAALNTLRQAKALIAAANDASSLESRIKSLARKIAPGEKLDLKVTPEDCRSLGFLELTNTPQSWELDRALGEPLLLFGAGDRGVRIVCLKISRPQNGVYPWTVTQAEEGMRSTSSSSFNLRHDSTWQHSFSFPGKTVRVNVTPQPGKDRMRYKIQTEPEE